MITWNGYLLCPLISWGGNSVPCNTDRDDLESAMFQMIIGKLEGRIICAKYI